MHTSHWKIFALSGVAIIVALSLYSIFADVKPLPNASIQMSRIDFAEAVDEAEAAAIQRTVMKQNGVKHCFFNHEAGLLTFGYDLRVQNKEAVLASVIAQHGHEAQLFRVTEEMAASSCPVTGNGSPIGKVYQRLEALW